MEDKRKLNGGHSTKSKEGNIDKRKNEYRKALEEASSKQDVIDVINMIKIKAVKDKDVQAGKLFLETSNIDDIITASGLAAAGVSGAHAE